MLRENAEIAKRARALVTTAARRTRQLEAALARATRRGHELVARNLFTEVQDARLAEDEARARYDALMLKIESQL